LLLCLFAFSGLAMAWTGLCTIAIPTWHASLSHAGAGP
jgi:hypothetical protein